MCGSGLVEHAGVGLEQRLLVLLLGGELSRRAEGFVYLPVQGVVGTDQGGSMAKEE